MSLNGSKGLSCSELVGHNGSLSREAMGVLIERRAVVEQNQGDSFEWYFLSSGNFISGNAVMGRNLLNCCSSQFLQRTVTVLGNDTLR